MQCIWTEINYEWDYNLYLKRQRKRKGSISLSTNNLFSSIFVKFLMYFICCDLNANVLVSFYMYRDKIPSTERSWIYATYIQYLLMAYKMSSWFLPISIFVLKTLDLTGIYILNFTTPTSQGENGKWAGTSEDEKVTIYCDTHFVSRYDIYFLCIAIYRYIDILWHS